MDQRRPGCGLCTLQHLTSWLGHMHAVISMLVQNTHRWFRKNIRDVSRGFKASTNLGRWGRHATSDSEPGRPKEDVHGQGASSGLADSLAFKMTIRVV